MVRNNLMSVYVSPEGYVHSVDTGGLSMPKYSGPASSVKMTVLKDAGPGVTFHRINPISRRAIACTRHEAFACCKRED